MNFYKQMRQLINLKMLVMAVAAPLVLALSSCDQSKPSKFQIKAYIENYQVVNKYKVQSFNYEITPNQHDQSGLIHASGQLELSEALYVEDRANKQFRKRVAKMMRRNRFTEREISHDIYDRVIRASTRVPNTENGYYTFLEKERDPGLAINFSANLTYHKSNGNMIIDGKVGHARIKGEPLTSFPYPVTDDTAIVVRTLKNVLAEQAKYQDMAKQSRDFLKQLWDNDNGFLLWNRKSPYAGTDGLSNIEREQLAQLSEWQGIFHVSHIKPVVFRESRASQFFELGYYKTEGIATCLRQTGFIGSLKFAKTDSKKYCELGKQYPVTLNFGSKLNAQNLFYTSVTFEVNGVSSGEYSHDAGEFKFEENGFAKYRDQQRLEILAAPFDISEYARPTLREHGADTQWLSLSYAATKNSANSRLQTTEPEPQLEIEALETPKEAVEKQETKVVIIDSSDEDTDKPVATTARAEVTTTITPIKMSKSQLTKATQVELQRLKLYSSSIDGIVGAATVWSINYFQKQQGIPTTGTPSEELLLMLRTTSEDAINRPSVAKSNKPKAKKEEKKGTIVGKAANWISSKFKKK